MTSTPLNITQAFQPIIEMLDQLSPIARLFIEPILIVGLMVIIIIILAFVSLAITNLTVSLLNIFDPIKKEK